MKWIVLLAVIFIIIAKLVELTPVLNRVCVSSGEKYETSLPTARTRESAAWPAE